MVLFSILSKESDQSVLVLYPLQCTEISNQLHIGHSAHTANSTQIATLKHFVTLLSGRGRGGVLP